MTGLDLVTLQRVGQDNYILQKIIDLFKRNLGRPGAVVKTDVGKKGLHKELASDCAMLLSNTRLTHVSMQKVYTVPVIPMW